MRVPGNQPASYTGGGIQAVDLPPARSRRSTGAAATSSSGAPTTWCSIERRLLVHRPRQAPRARARPHRRLLCAPRRSSIVEAIFPLDGPNGVGLSPEQDRLYIAETTTGRVFYWELDGPGAIRRNPRSPNGGHFLAGVAGLQLFDSLAIDGDGNVCVATIVNGGITVISPKGEVLEHVPCPTRSPPTSASAGPICAPPTSRCRERASWWRWTGRGRAIASRSSDPKRRRVDPDDSIDPRDSQEPATARAPRGSPAPPGRCRSSVAATPPSRASARAARRAPSPCLDSRPRRSSG